MLGPIKLRRCGILICMNSDQSVTRVGTSVYKFSSPGMGEPIFPFHWRRVAIPQADAEPPKMSGRRGASWCRGRAWQSRPAESWWSRPEQSCLTREESQQGHLAAILLQNWSVTLLSCCTAVLYSSWAVCAERSLPKLGISVGIEFVPITIVWQLPKKILP